MDTDRGGDSGRRRRRQEQRRQARPSTRDHLRTGRVLGAVADHRHLHRDRLARGLQDASSSTTSSSMPACPPTCARRSKSADSPNRCSCRAPPNSCRRSRRRSRRHSIRVRCQSLPLSSRSAFDFVVFLPGVPTPPAARANRLINGLPQGTINITLDGVNIQDNTNRRPPTASLPSSAPRLDAVEEITVSTRGAGRRRHAAWARRRSGSSRDRAPTTFTAACFYHVSQRRVERQHLVQQARQHRQSRSCCASSPGSTSAARSMLPGFDGRNKAFFFVNYEELREPGGTRRTRTILHPAAQQGVFRYNAAGGVQSVNLFELAARRDRPRRPIRSSRGCLHDIRNATPVGRQRPRSDRSAVPGVFVPEQDAGDESLPDRSPRLPVDDRHRAHLFDELSILRRRSRHDQQPRPVFPGFPVVGNQTSDAPRVEHLAALDDQQQHGQRVALRLRRRARRFLRRTTSPRDMWYRIDRQSGRLLPEHQQPDVHHSQRASGSAHAVGARRLSPHRLRTRCSWQKGSHSLSIGGSFSQLRRCGSKISRSSPSCASASMQGDPAEAMFVGREFPGCVDGRHHQRAPALRDPDRPRQRDARRGAARTTSNEYQYNGLGRQLARQRRVGFWVAGLLAHAPEPVAQLRPALRTAVPVRRAEQQLFDRRLRRRVRRVRRRQHLQARHPDRAAADLPSTRRRTSSPIRWTGTTSRRASAWPGRPTRAAAASCARSPATPATWSSAAVIRSSYSRNGLGRLHRRDRRTTPACRSNAFRSAVARQPRPAAAAAARHAAASARRPSHARSSSRTREVGDRRHHHLQPGSAVPSARNLAGRRDSARSASACRSRRATSGRAPTATGAPTTTTS